MTLMEKTAKTVVERRAAKYSIPVKTVLAMLEDGGWSSRWVARLYRRATEYK